MRGRFTQFFTWSELVELDPAGGNLRPRCNIAPTTTIDVVRSLSTVEQLGTPIGIRRAVRLWLGSFRLVLAIAIALAIGLVVTAGLGFFLVGVLAPG
jgi:hypothetical protein